MRLEDSIYRYSSIIKTSLDNTNATNNSKDALSPKQSFEEILNQKIGTQELTFSKHAVKRLEERDIQLTENDLLKLNEAVKKAEEKGVDNSLILMGKGAFIINVTNNIVITAMNENDMKENVFTQIDGAVIV